MRSAYRLPTTGYVGLKFPFHNPSFNFLGKINVPQAVLKAIIFSQQQMLGFELVEVEITPHLSCLKMGIIPDFKVFYGCHDTVIKPVKQRAQGGRT